MNQHTTTMEAGDQGVAEYITDLLGSLSVMADQAGLRRLAGDLEEVRRRHLMATNLLQASRFVSRGAVDA